MSKAVPHANAALPPPEINPAAPARPSGASAGVRRVAAAGVLFGVLLIGAWQLTGRPFIDHDIYHQITLWRDALMLGRMPREDLHSFVPTIRPSIHYEWGTGTVLYYITTQLGAPGIALLRAVLLSAITLVCARRARRGGASWPVLAAAAPLFFQLIGPSLSPVRAQMFTMLLVAIQFLMLDADRRGSRRWMAAWVPMYILWLNLHGGFILGPVLLGAHWLEQLVRTRSAQWHLIAVGLLAIPLTLINPYGLEYLPFMWRALGMARPMLAEWGPLWNDPSELATFLLAAGMALYAVWRRGVASTPGVLVVGAIGIQALLHIRHVPLFAVAWCCTAPAWLSGTPLGDIFQRTWRARPWLWGACFAIMGIFLLPMVRPSAWAVRLPVSPEDHYRVMMPVGAVSYLHETGFAGRLMTPFQGSSYIPWHLPATVRIGIDSRYDAVYEPGVVEEISSCYRAEPGWQKALEKYGPDLVLVPRTAQLAKAIAADSEWNRIYRDDAFEIYARPGSALPTADRTGVPIDRSYP
jgi:hypothetical protein